MSICLLHYLEYSDKFSDLVIIALLKQVVLVILQFSREAPLVRHNSRGLADQARPVTSSKSLSKPQSEVTCC